MNTLDRHWRRVCVASWWLLCVVGLIYVGNAWSPSSYGHVLRVAGASQTGVIWGEPRGIRSDEWSVTTPLTQATVNNGLERFNHTSFYNEDLRINYAMPIRDWGMVFKPTQWGYLLVPPAYAFSLHYFLMFGLFIFGYAHFFRIVGAPTVAAFLLSVSLYQTGFVQFFWNSNTSLFAFFPWILVAWTSMSRLWLRLLLLFWLSTCWLVGNFYPPLFISLAFVALVVVLAYRPDLLRPGILLPVLAVSLAACGIAIFYLWDYLVQTLSTSYPGQRISAGGTYPGFMFLTQLWPAALFDFNYRESVDFTNVAGVGTVGLYWTLAALCMADWSRWRRLAPGADRALAWLAGGWGLTLLWMYAPIPSWAGRFLLWDRVPPERMVYASGLLLVVLVFHVVRVLGIRSGLKPVAVYGGVMMMGWLFFEALTRNVAGPWAHPHELAMIPAALLAWRVGERFQWPGSNRLLIAGLVCSVLVFGRFNPIQSAVPIFDHAPNPMTQVLKANVDTQGVLPVQRKGLIGATLNGLGFRAVAHLNAVPPMAVWRDKFGELSPSDRAIVNRYAHIRLSSSEHLRLLENDQVGVPVALFREQPSLVGPMDHAPPGITLSGGALDSVRLEPTTLLITGWAPWRSTGKSRQLLLSTNLAVDGMASVFDVERWDIVTSTPTSNVLLSGFTVSVRLTAPPQGGEWLCVYGRDGEDGPLYLLPNPPTGLKCATKS